MRTYSKAQTDSSLELLSKKDFVHVPSKKKCQQPNQTYKPHVLGRELGVHDGTGGNKKSNAILGSTESAK